MITVRTNVRGRDQGSFVKEWQEKIGAQVPIPKGYAIFYDGQYENRERAGQQLLLAIPLTLLLYLYSRSCYLEA